MIVVDASVLIAHFSAADAHHEHADALLESSVGERLVIHSLTLTEMLVGAARTGAIEGRLNDILSLGVERWASDSDEPIRLATLRAQNGLKLPACCVLSAAIATSSSIATFDAQLRKAAQALGITLYGT